MPKNIVMRTAKKSELNAILELYKDLHEKDMPFPSKKKMLQSWNAIRSNNIMKLLVAVNQKNVVSTCTVLIIPNLTRGGRPYGLIENVVTASQYQGKGFGTLVIQHALNIAWKKKCYKVMLMSSRKNAFRFYEKMGFIRGIKTAFVAYPPKR